MSSMIVSTYPRRRILQASADLAESLDCRADLMLGLDCASLVRCRNAEGKPLCHDFCPALMASRDRSREAVTMQVWLEAANGSLTQVDATFQRLDGGPNGLVIGVFEEPAEVSEEAGSFRQGVWPDEGAAGAPRGLQLVSG